MKNKIIVISSILVLLSFIGIFSSIYILKENDNSISKKENNTINTLNDNEMADEKVTITEETKIENETTNSTIDNSKSNTTKNENKSNEVKQTSPTTSSKNNTSSNSQTQKQETTTPVQKEEVKQEVVIPKEEPKKYIGVPSPNDLNYSFHLGRIDDAYTTLSECYNKSYDVMFLDTVDIINAVCYEVVDDNSSVLGIYMKVNCSSGNCERYKKLVGINTN